MVGDFCACPACLLCRAYGAAFSIPAQALPELVDQVVEVVQRHAPGDYTPTVKPSSKGNYHSVSITINATHIEQVETLYEELGKIDIVRMVL